MQIVASIFGAISDPKAWQEFSCINPDGTLNEDRYKKYIDIFADDGANATREITFLIPENDVEFNRDYMPFKFYDGKYDLTQLNPIFFDNLRKMVKIANKRGIKFYYSLFDRCHGKFSHSPWRNNHQGIDSFYDLPESIWLPYVKKIIDKIKYKFWKIFRYKVGFEVVNEPFSSKYPDFAIKIINYLLGRGYKLRDIIPGHQHLPHKNPVDKGFKKAARKHDEKSKRKIYKKDQYFSCIHGIGKENKFPLMKWKHLQSHTRRFWFSDDGNHPKRSALWWEKNLYEYLRYKRIPKRNKAIKNDWAFEHLYRFHEDDIHGVRGIVKAIRRYGD